MSDRLPPHSIEAEQSILGCILLDPKAVLPEVRSAAENPEDWFYDLRHATIFAAMTGLDDDSLPIDTVTLHERLRGMGKLDEVGGVSFIASLPEAAASTANLETYVAIVSDKAALRRLIVTCTRTVANAYQADAEAEIIVGQAEREILTVRRQRKSKTPATKEIVRQALDEIERLHVAQGALGGLSTGLKDLDRATDGMHPEEMIVVAGFPGGGKSALAMNMAEHVALELKQPVGVFSLEMSAKRLMLRLLASKGRVNLRNIRDGQLTPGDFPKLLNAGAALGNSGLHFCDLSDLTISQLRAKARQMIQQHDVKLFVIDYLQLLTAPGKKDASREQEVSAISRGVKLMACEFNVPVIALSQLNEDGKLRESRAIGQDADCIWRIKPKDGAQEVNGAMPTQLEILKQRDGEAPKTIDLMFMKQFTRFENAAQEMPRFK